MKSAFAKIRAGILDAIEAAKRPCPKCKGWGIQDPATYRVEPCPDCGSGLSAK